jgi:hypothetical protein
MNRLSRLFIIVALLLVLGVAAAVAAHTPAGALRSAKRATVTPPSNDPLVPGWLCRAQRDALGTATFNQLWGGRPAAQKSAMGRCVTLMANADAQGRASQMERSIMAAHQACMRMRKTNSAGFRKRFGVSTNRSNALGRCIRARTGSLTTVS